MGSRTPAGDELYRALLELSAEAIARVELDPPLRVERPADEQVEHILRWARVAECNDAYARLYGRGVASDIQGRALTELVPSGERRDLVRQFVEAGYRLVQGEVRHALDDGSTRWMVDNALGFIEDGRLHGYWITLHDITSRKRLEEHRAGRDRILEAVAFGAARLLESGTWESHAQEVLARLGEATEAGRVTLAEVVDGEDSPHVRYRFLWSAPGLEVSLEDPRLSGPISIRDLGLERIEGELRAGRAIFTLVSGLEPSERVFYERFGTKSFAVVPVVAGGRYWGFLGFTESRYAREWSMPEVEALRAAAALFGGAIARDRAAAAQQRGDRILEAVAFGAARLLGPGEWKARADAVLARIGQATGAARAWLGATSTDPDGSLRLAFQYVWAQPGHEIALDDPRIRDGVNVAESGLARIADQLRRGLPVVITVSSLPPAERVFIDRTNSKSFAAVPVFASGALWGVLGLGETRFERSWSVPEVEALKAAAAVFGAAVERERAESALRESEERFKRLSAAAFEGIAITEGGTLLDGNEQMARMLGCEVTDLLGRHARDFVAEQDRARVDSYMRSGSEGPFQHLARRANGSVFPVEVRARAIPFEGRTVRVSAIRDVSAQVAAEDRQRRLEADLLYAAEQWRQTVDALDLGIVLVDDESRMVRLNRAALALAGTDFASLVGRRLDELPAGEPWRAALDVQRRVGDGGRSVAEEEVLDPATRRCYSVFGSPWFRPESDGPWCVVTFRDVTAFTTMQAQLRRARTLEAMGSLVAGVAHEVRNPLFSISATVDALESELGPRPEFSEYAALLRSQVGRLTQLMHDLLDYGRPSELHRGPVRLADVVRRAMRSCAALARDRHVRVEEEGVAPDLPTLAGEGARLEQAVENLLANAIQHAPAGTSVRVRAALDTLDGRPAVRCTLEDAGPGIAAADLERLFDPFFSRRKGGTGLGLSIVHRVAEAHGGTVTAENRPEGGARFALVLPVRPPEGGPEA